VSLQLDALFTHTSENCDKTIEKSREGDTQFESSDDDDDERDRIVQRNGRENVLSCCMEQ